MNRETLAVIAQGTPLFREVRHGRGKLQVQWRVKSQAPFLPAHDTNWTRFGRVSDTTYGRRMVRAMNREDPIFEYRLKPELTPNHEPRRTRNRA